MSFSDDIQNALLSQMLKQEEEKILAPMVINAGLGTAPIAALMFKDLTIESKVLIEPFPSTLQVAVHPTGSPTKPFIFDWTTEKLEIPQRTFTRVSGILSLLYLED